jgi:cysteine-rich repeat protein
VRSSVVRDATATVALLAGLAALPTLARAQSFTPGDVFWAGSFTPTQLLNVTGGGNFAGAMPLATLAGRTIGQMAWSLDRSTLYVSLFALDRVDAVTTSGMQSTFATGVTGPTGLLATRDGRLLVASFFSGEVIDITGGGNFAGTPAFASGLPGPRNLVQLADDRIMIAAQSGGRVVDISAGGNFAADPGFAFGLSNPLDIVQDAAGTIFASESSSQQVTDITAGGDFTGVAPFASGRQFGGLAIDGSGRLLANTVLGTNAYDITAGGNFSAAPEWAFNLPFAETAFDAVPPIVCGDGQLDPLEQCDDGNTAAGDCCSATCTFETAGGPCPDDGQTCTADQCDGGGTCLHPSGNGGAICRAPAGACDVAETCDGVSASCPSDVVQLLGSVCRAMAGSCDVGETCDGISPACPADAVQPSGASCRTSAGPCDLAESCTGSSPSCPPDAVQPLGSVCRASVAACDFAETCDGTTVGCPADGLWPAGTVCRASTDLCDAAEQCDGVGIGCPADVLRASGASCRVAAGVCDLAETCTGTGAACPPDVKSTTQCRAAAGPCDLTETCSGSDDDCPTDLSAADGSSCSDGAFCNGAEQCQSGACAAGTLPCSSFCDEGGDMCVSGCPSAPQACRTAEKSFVLVRNTANEARDKLLWKWIKGAATQLEELGDPTTSTDYALCLYIGTPPTLLPGGEIEVPADPSRWSAVRTVGYQYTDVDASIAGAHRVKLKISDENKSRALVKGKAAALPDPPLPIAEVALPLRVQLFNTATTACFESIFDSTSVIVSTDELFKARTPP